MLHLGLDVECAFDSEKHLDIYHVQSLTVCSGDDPMLEDLMKMAASLELKHLTTLTVDLHAGSS